MAQLRVRPARDFDRKAIDALRLQHYATHNVVMPAVRRPLTYVICRGEKRIVACAGYIDDAEGIVMDDLFAEPTRLGKAAAGVILRWMHDFADARGKTLCGVTMHKFIVEHALRRGWQVAGMALVRPPGGS